MILPKSAKTIGAALLVGLQASRLGVDAHGYLKTPRSRNYYASIDPIWFGGTADDPAPENCPHCLNIGGTEAQCGIVGDHNYDYPPNAIGSGVLSTNLQACYEEGAVIDVESVLTAHHKGHFEVRACPITDGEVPTEDCFNNNKLTFVSDELYGAQPDPLFPGRAYIPRTDYPGGLSRETNGNYNFHHKFKLPDGLVGDLVLIQWYYITANSCLVEGYDTYDWPEGFYPGNSGVCDSIPPDGRGVPEQFWNCAEVEIKVAGTNGCGTLSPATTLSPTKAPSVVNTTPSPTSSPMQGVTTSTTSSTLPNTPNPPNPNPNCQARTNSCGLNKPCAEGLCCSQWGYCGQSADYCGDCCQNGACFNSPGTSAPTKSGGGGGPPSPTTPNPTPPPVPPTPSAGATRDSRLIAYVGNWQACPTQEQLDGYTHIIVAFAVSYTWNSAKNQCSQTCDIGTSVPLCNGQTSTQVADWQALGKKVILSFGGAGMGGSWGSDVNDCWDYCFGREETISSDLVAMVSSQGFDGVDLDYEYCYDVAGNRHGRNCNNSSSGLYTDAKAQTFLEDMTDKLRTKMDALGSGYELTHAPMDSDLETSSPYYQILKARNAKLDFLMPQFYNGDSRPILDGFANSDSGAYSTAFIYDNLANDLFQGQPEKVVFGFCISDCSGTSSNANSAQAVTVMQDLKAYNGGEFECNGGAFFWVAAHDGGGSWSNGVWAEVSKTSGCSEGGTRSPSRTPTKVPTGTPTSGQPSMAPTKNPTSNPTTQPESTAVTTTSATTTTTTTTTSTSSIGNLVLNNTPRCGFSEIDARESCKQTCATDADCEGGEWCYQVHNNYCESIPQRIYEQPKRSPVVSRCGISEEMARTFCGEECSWECSKPGESCIPVHANWCDSTYTEVVVTTAATTTSSPGRSLRGAQE